MLNKFDDEEHEGLTISLALVDSIEEVTMVAYASNDVH